MNYKMKIKNQQGDGDLGEDYMYCEKMKRGEEVSHLVPFTKEIDPIWFEEVKVRPPSPKTDFGETKFSKYVSDLNFMKKDKGMLSAIELDFIQMEFKKKTAGKKFDIKLVDQIVKSMDFFIKFNQNLRHKILKRSSLVKHPRGKVVFRQGDYGDKMYILLKGSVNVVINMPDKFTGEIKRKTVAWMRDGESFGEYSMLGGETRGSNSSVFIKIKDLKGEMKEREDYLKQGIVYGREIDLKKNNFILERKKYDGKKKVYVERTKREADIIIAEDACMLELSREFFKEIILLTIKDEYEKKMRLIAEISFFRHHNMLKLMPAVNFFKKKTYKLGQCIVRQGDLMTDVIVIAKGRCKVVDISIRNRTKVKSFKVRGLRPKLRRMNHGAPNLERTKDKLSYDQRLKKLVRKMEKEKKEQERIEMEDNEYKWGNLNRNDTMGYSTKQERLKEAREKAKEEGKHEDFREFSYIEENELTKKDAHYRYYRDHAFVKYLERGSIIGLRCLKKYTMKKTNEGFKLNENFAKFANLTVLAETASVDVYVFDIENFKYLTQEIKKTLLEATENTLDFDEEAIQDIKKFSDNWDYYKVTLFNDKISEQFDIRTRNHYSYYKDF